MLLSTQDRTRGPLIAGINPNSPALRSSHWLFQRPSSSRLRGVSWMTTGASWWAGRVALTTSPAIISSIHRSACELPHDSLADRDRFAYAVGVLENVPRLPWSQVVSPAWSADWRNRQADAYMLAFQTRVFLSSTRSNRESVASALLAEVRFPAHENDVIVSAKFWHALGASAPNSKWTDALDWCVAGMRMDPSAGFFTSLKGWLLSGLSDEAIAERMPVPPLFIQVYHDLLFNVRGSLAWPDALLRILCGRQLPNDAPEWERRERTVMYAALTEGIEAVDRLVRPCAKTSDSELEWLVKHRAQAQARLAWDRTMGNAAMQTRQTDIAVHQEDQRVSVNRDIAQAKQALDNKSDEKSRRFFEELSAVWEEHGAVSEPEEFIASGAEEEEKPPVEAHGWRMRRVG